MRVMEMPLMTPDDEADLKARFAEWFRENRKRVFGSQMEAAVAMGQSLTTVSKWERGKMLPDFRNWVKISRAFGLADPLGADDERPTDPPPDDDPGHNQTEGPVAHLRPWGIFAAPELVEVPERPRELAPAA